MDDYSFPKSSRLSGKKDIDHLFKAGKSAMAFPFRILKLESKDSAKVLFSVPYRNFRRATDRNRVKRLMREAWRKNRHLLGPVQPQLIAYIYTAKDILPYQTISERMVLSFRHLKDRNEKN